MDAARIDGAGEVRILWQVVLPLSLPVIAFLGYSTFTAVWDQFTWPLVVLGANPHRWPLSVALNSAQRSLVPSPTSSPNAMLAHGVLSYNGVMALAVLQAVPVFVAFLLFREQIIRGVKITGFQV